MDTTTGTATGIAYAGTMRDGIETREYPDGTVTVKSHRRYTVLIHDGHTGNPYPEAPGPDNTVRTLTEARHLFARWLRDTNPYDDIPTQAYADIVYTTSWDGISYGDITGGDGIERLTVGPRGGIIRNNF